MRLLVLTPSLPESLNSKTPWHFFQELLPLAQSGLNVIVASATLPAYDIPGLRFEQVRVTSLKRAPRRLVSVFRFLLPLLGAIDKEKIANVRQIRQLLRCAAWNYELKGLITRVRPDVIHSHWAFPGNSGGAIAARALGVPLVLTLRGFEHNVMPEHNYGACLEPSNQVALRYALRIARLITVCCADSVSRIESIEPGSAKKARLVYHAVDEGRLNANFAHAADLWRSHHLLEHKVIVCVARMENVSQKGLPVLLRAFQKLSNRSGDVRLLLVGDGPERSRLQGYVRQLAIESTVLMIGGVHPNDVGGIMARAAVTVLPSFGEAFANVVFESLLMKTPVVSTAVGAPKDLLRDFGITVPVGDPEALASAIQSVLDEPVKYKRMATLGAEFVRDNMTVARRVENYSALYSELLAEDAPNAY